MDRWITSENDCSLRFTFNGQLWLQILDGSSLAEAIGTWELREDVIFLSFTDGSSQEVAVADQLELDYCGKTFIRWKNW